MRGGERRWTVAFLDLRAAVVQAPAVMIIPYESKLYLSRINQSFEQKQMSLVGKCREAYKAEVRTKRKSKPRRN
jgi:hypothetical protein